MAVKHTKVVSTPDDGTSDVGTDEWNDNHIIDDNTITNDHLAGSIAQSKITSLTSDLTSKAPLASPTFTGTVVLPNVPAIVTTQLDLKAPIASPTFTGTATIPPVILKSQGIAGLGGLTIEPTASNAIQNTCFNPSGTGNRSQITINRQSDPTVNADSLSIGGDIYNTNAFAIRTYSSGTGTTRDLQFFHGTTNLMQLTSSGLTFSSTLNMGGNNIDSVKNIDHNVSAITHSASNTILNFALDQVQYLSVNANTTFTTSNILAGKSKTIKIIADGTDRVLTFPAAFRWVGTAPTSNTHTITASKLAVLTMTCFADASDANVLCAFALEE